MSIRDEVFEHLIEMMQQADAAGQDPVAAAKAKYPGAPDSVLGEALWMAEERKAGAWWQAVEKTIDGEIIKAALLNKGSSA